MEQNLYGESKSNLPFEQKASALGPRFIRSARRLRYEAEVQVITNEIGGLEVVRHTLGLSQRRMCELLLVDPSAWTRWTKMNQAAPPHIYRMLEWYLLVKKEHAGLAHQFYERRPMPEFQKQARLSDSLSATKHERETPSTAIHLKFQRELKKLELSLATWQRISILMFAVACSGFFVLLYQHLK